MFPEVILFDLGGVLVELIGVPIMLQWSDHSLDDDSLWHAWLHSGSVRAFESGKIGPQQFADSLIEEMELQVSRDEFLAAFTYWPRGLFPGAAELLSGLRNKSYAMACLSNSNELHWPRMMGEMGLSNLIDEHYSSHQLGMLKPDAEVFDYVTGQLGCRADAILFMDDNTLNVDAARRAGMNSFRTRGVTEVGALLTELGITLDP
jgi:FMN phosphatase YigB (HAD superfamily)